MSHGKGVLSGFQSFEAQQRVSRSAQRDLAQIYKPINADDSDAALKCAPQGLVSWRAAR